MKTLKMKWTGSRPLVMHNGALADRQNEYAQQIAAINKVRKKSDDNHIERERLEFYGGLY